MFWSLFIFRGHSTQKLASVVCNDEQGDLFYYADPHRNQCKPQPRQEKFGRSVGKNTGGWTGRVKISKEEISGNKRSMHGNILTYCSKEVEITLNDVHKAHTGSIQQRCRQAVQNYYLFSGRFEDSQSMNAHRFCVI